MFSFLFNPGRCPRLSHLGPSGLKRSALPAFGKSRRVRFQSLEIFAAVCLLGFASAYGQATRTIRFPDGSIRVESVSDLEAEIGNEFEPSKPSPRSSKLAVSMKPDSTNALSASEAQSLVSKAMSLDYQRNAYAFYRVLDEQRQRGGPGSAADQFGVAVTMGDWERVGKLLGRSPSNSAAQVYSRMLAGLAKNSRAQQSLFKRYEGVKPVTEAPEPVDPNEAQISYSYRSSSETMNGVFLTDDFFGVVEAAPGSLSADDLRAIAALAKVALPGESGQRQFAERLKAGLKNFRESVPAECANAARLLCALGWTHMAEPYLPATAREAGDASVEDALLAAEYFTAKGAAENDAKTKERAWGLLAAAAKKGADADVVADRVMAYAPSLDADFVRRALPALLTNSPALEQPLFERLAKIAAVQPDRSSSSGEEKTSAQAARALRVQALLMEGLTASGADTKSKTELFNGLIWNWLGAADQSRSMAEQAAQQQARENFYGRQSYGSQRSTVSSGDVLASAPAEVVVAKLGTGLARQVRLMKFALMLLEFDEPRAREYVELCCREHPADARDLASNFLTAWVDKRSSALAKEDPELARMRLQNPYYAQQMQAASAMKPGGIPLTRARQNKNIAELKQLLVDLRKLAPSLDPARVTWAFINIHSGAEVYRDDDIAAIFGPTEKMERNELRMLVAAMRVNLARGWRDAEVQTKAGTNRSEQDVKDEVSRGYGVALNLVKRGLGAEGGDWEDSITRGQLYFDASEFERDRNVKLADYINLRDAAFASFKQAAINYGGKVQTLQRGKWTIAPYQAWFFVLLGASDLSALSARQARNDLGLVALHDAIASLPGEAAEVHTKLFAATLTNLLERVPSQMKQKFLAAGVQVVGEKHPTAAPAQAVLDYYANLTDEAQLRLSLDGSTRVGHGKPFGAFVLLEHTKQLAREGGGFSKYLQNQAAQMQAMYGSYMPPGQRPIDYKSNFETNLYAALGAQFDIVSVTFADPAVKPVDVAREGWQAMPLAYVVLKAKDPAVDRIPSIQLDVDFADQKGTVVLPVLSQVLPINCADKDIAARPVANLALAMTLDTREWRGSGKLTFEIAAMGNGIIPPLKELCAIELDGLEAEIKDTGLNIASFGGDKGAPQPQAARSWQITYLAKKGAAVPAFRFPQLAKDFSSAKVEYKRYVDADLETVAPATALAGVSLPASRLSGMNRWLWTAGIAVFVIANLIFLRRWGRPAKAAAPNVALPSEFSPFAVVSFLRRIVSDHAAKMNEADRAALLSDIRSIEAAHFAAQPAASAPDLRSLAERWQRRAM